MGPGLHSAKEGLKRNRNKRVKLGLCYYCSRKQIKGKTRCEFHLEKEKKEVEQMEEKEKPKRKSPIEKVAKILVPQEQAKVEWKKYCELLKKRKDKHLKIMKEAMYFAKQGKKILDVYEAIQKAGLNKNGEPRFAIARADFNNASFRKMDEGSGIFGDQWNKDSVSLPQKTFKIHWERKEGRTDEWNIKDRDLQTKVPIIPADLMPEGDLSNYYILWEVKEWEKLPETKDPFLLKRISENLFVILGTWDVTELERAIIGGLK